jgi:RNA-binding protein 25
MLQLLAACGPVREWKLSEDPQTAKHKGFGFCTYEEPESVLIAMRVLNNLSVDGSHLAFKCNSVRCLTVPYRQLPHCCYSHELYV